MGMLHGMHMFAIAGLMQQALRHLVAAFLIELDGADILFIALQQ